MTDTAQIHDDGVAAAVSVDREKRAVLVSFDFDDGDGCKARVDLEIAPTESADLRGRMLAAELEIGGAPGELAALSQAAIEFEMGTADELADHLGVTEAGRGILRAALRGAFIAGALCLPSSRNPTER